MKNSAFIILLFLFPLMAFPQDDTTKTRRKKPYNISGLPVIAYDADMGFQFGAFGAFYYYGEGNESTEYRHAIKAEVSRYTKGSGVNQVFYDSKYLIPNGIRLTADISYLTERALDFYGFNGYQAVYSPELEDDDDSAYVTRMFYRHDRRMFRFTCDFQGPMVGEKLLWLAGIGIMNFKTGTVDIDHLNKGKKEDKQLPDTVTLYDLYTEDWGIISGEEKDGGNINFIKAGLVFDTRDNEPFPKKGLWDELLFVYSPEFLFNEQSFLKLILIHRQYFSLVKNRLVFAYRLGYQGTIAGHTPYYFQPYMLSSFSYVTKTDGLGGAKNLRGITRNRVVGDGVAWGNVEFRSRLVDFRIAGANFYIGLNIFGDAGLVVQEIDFDRDRIPLDDQDEYFDFSYSHDKLHPTVGGGLRVGWNENFIVAVDYGFALNGQDGKSGLYIAFGNLF